MLILQLRALGKVALTAPCAYEPRLEAHLSRMIAVRYHLFALTHSFQVAITDTHTLTHTHLHTYTQPCKASISLLETQSRNDWCVPSFPPGNTRPRFVFLLWMGSIQGRGGDERERRGSWEAVFTGGAARGLWRKSFLNSRPRSTAVS